MVGKLLDRRYKLLKILGAGAYAQTYIAEDTRRPSHPKCLVKHLQPASQDPTFLEVARRLFKTEAETLAKLGSHDQIPQILAYFEENQEFYLVQEFIEGHLLSDELLSGTRMPEVEAIAMLQDILTILEFIHAHQVIHRDIKPNNIIRRDLDGKLVLIDFGAVKEIRHDLLGEHHETGLTVGIGTHGYMPSEQLAGQPRFNSDIYALGMTIIQAVTGFRPSQLPVNSDTGAVIWRDKAEISDRFATILEKMVRYHFRDRYQSVTEVIQALQPLVFSAALTRPPIDPNSLPDQTTSPSLPALLNQLWQKLTTSAIPVVTVGTLAATSMVLGLRQLGWLERLELESFDRMLSLNAGHPGTPDVLVVGINEADIQTLEQWPLSDQAIARLLAKLLKLQPRVIGLDIDLDVPHEPGHAELIEQLQNPKIMVVNSLDQQGNIIANPPEIVPTERIGFNNLLTDPDGVVRRSLLFTTRESQPPADSFIFLSGTNLHYSLAWRLVEEFLRDRNLTPKVLPTDPLQLQWGKATMTRLKHHSGGYQTINPSGFQVLLNYTQLTAETARNPQLAQQVSLMEVLNDQVDPNWVKDKIVLIGVTSPRRTQQFMTPKSSANSETPKIPAVMVHAQIVQQILTGVLDASPWFWFWPEWVETAWIFGWGFTGAAIAWRVRHPLGLTAAEIGLLGLLWGTSFGIFSLHGWVSVVTPTLAIVCSAGTIISYRLYRLKQLQERAIAQMVSQLFGQEASLETLLENQSTQPTFPPARFNSQNSWPRSATPAHSTGSGRFSLKHPSTGRDRALPAKPVTFPEQGTTTTLSGRLDANQRQRFLLSGSQGQPISLRVQEGKIVMALLAPDGRAIATIDSHGDHWQGLLPISGDYTLDVCGGEAGDFSLSLELQPLQSPLNDHTLSDLTWTGDHESTSQDTDIQNHE